MIAASRARLPLISPLLRSIRHGSSSRSGPNRQPSIRRFVPDSLAASAKVSLADELFPERQNNGGDKEPLSDAVDEKDLLLPLPSLEELLADQKKASRPRIKTDAASQNAVKQENCAVLLLQSASTSLVENDFRLLCPKGKHIEGWTSLGDIEKIIPGRDPATLERSSYYFLLFRNPAHALAYQANALRLYRHARAHTPSSISSPAAPSPGSQVPRQFRQAFPVSQPPPLADPLPPSSTPGSDASAIPGEQDSYTQETPPPPPLLDHEANPIEEEEPEDAYTLFQDFALCAPAQRLNLTYIRPPFSPALLRLIARGGYLGNRAGRAVRLSITAGPRARATDVQAAIARDGRRGGGERDYWDAHVEELGQVTAVQGRGKNQNRTQNGASHSSEPPPPGHEASAGRDTATGNNASPQDTYIVTLADESTAQRFFRAWNQRRVVFSASEGRGGVREEQGQEDRAAVVRTEVLW